MVEFRDGYNIVFQHKINAPKCDCVFCARRNNEAGNTRLFLVFDERRKIYIRNGVKETWEELTDERAHNCIRQRFNEAVVEREVPMISR